MSDDKEKEEVKLVPTIFYIGNDESYFESLKEEYESEYILFALDAKGKNFRHDIDPNYKANRSAPPEELTMQLPIAIEWIDKMGYKTLGKVGFEADDMIATVVRHAKEAGHNVRVVSHDKDLYQLIDDGKIVVVDAIKRKSMDEDACFEKYGVTPKQFIDYQSILGDSADNVPGVKGIGKVGAEKLLKEFESFSFEDWSGASWPPSLVHRDLWEKVNGYSEEFAPGFYSDPDFSMKLWNIGVRVFKGVAASRVYHFQSKSLARIVKNDGRKQFYEKWGITASFFDKYFIKKGQKFQSKLESPSSYKIFLNKLKVKFYKILK